MGAYDTLTPRQLAFVNAIVLGKTGHASAIIAGYSPKYAETQASRMLSTNVKIQRAVAARRATISTRIEKTAADIARAMWGIINDPDAPHSAKVSAAALESKRYQEYSDKREVKSLTMNIDVEMGKDIDDDDRN